jgi:hypothetical protein
MKTIFIGLMIFIWPSLVYAQDNDNRKQEIGFWVSAANPLPGSDTQKILDTTLGGGFLYRIPWPGMFYTEFGGSYGVYLSRTEQALATAPFYAALAYKIPIEFPIQFFLKAGGGSALVIHRPSNTETWTPMQMLGFESSFIAGKKIRIGLRIDLNRFDETGKNLPLYYKYPFIGPYEDPRMFNPNYFQLGTADFFHFAIMVTYLL